MKRAAFLLEVASCVHASERLAQIAFFRVSFQPSTMASSAYPREGDQQPQRTSEPNWLKPMALRLELARGSRRHFASQHEEQQIRELAWRVRVDTSGATEDQHIQKRNAVASLKSADVCNSQMMTFCFGRPIVPLVITHERTAIRNFSRHISDCFCPYPVHYVMGRSAVMHPVCPPQHALWHTWKDSDAELSSHIHYLFCFYTVSVLVRFEMRRGNGECCE